MIALVTVNPSFSLHVTGGSSASVKLFLFMTLLSFATAILLSITSFTRIIILLSFVRQGLGTPQLPPNQVLLGLALALSAFIMAPTAKAVWTEALSPYMDDTLTSEEALKRASVPVRHFMLRHVRQDDLQLFYRISGAPRPDSEEEIPLTVAIPAFMVSELTTAFRMGLTVLVPMLLMDLLVSSILLSLGMMMVPPTLVSLPLKVGVFLLAGGWHLIVESTLRSFSP